MGQRLRRHWASLSSLPPLLSAALGTPPFLPTPMPRGSETAAVAKPSRAHPHGHPGQRRDGRNFFLHYRLITLDNEASPLNPPDRSSR